LLLATRVLKGEELNLKTNDFYHFMRTCMAVNLYLQNRCYFGLPELVVRHSPLFIPEQFRPIVKLWYILSRYLGTGSHRWNDALSMEFENSKRTMVIDKLLIFIACCFRDQIQLIV
jgi:hypothetical protein